MRLAQHVYGRVTKGFRTAHPGFQLAALTDSLANENAIEALNRFSFCHRWTGEGPRERFSVFRPAPGWMAFGCARVAKDRSGAVGSFAHNYVCAEDDFVASGVSPVSMLRCLTFFASEVDLPVRRELPPLDVEPSGAPARHPEWRSACLDLIDVYLGESAVVVPLVILDMPHTWDLLEELSSLLPRQELARLSFSTLFIEATDFLDGFRLVFVPERKALPREESLYRIVEPTLERERHAAARQVPFTNFWRSVPERGPSLCRWTDRMRREANADEIPNLLDDLLSTGRPFRDVVESLDVIKNTYGWLVRRPEWLIRFRQAGGRLSMAYVRDAVWGDPRRRLLPALAGARSIGDQEMVGQLFEDLGRQIVSAATLVDLAAGLSENGQLSPFLETVSDPRRFGDGELTSLADRLAAQPFYSGELHLEAARRVLVGIEERRRADVVERWVVRRAAECPEAFLTAVAALIRWLDGSRWRRPEFRLQDFGSVAPPSYGLLLKALWAVAPDASGFVPMAFRHDARQQFFAFCGRALSLVETDTQKELLHTLAGVCRPSGVENEGLIDVIVSSPKASELAKFYAACLERAPRPDQAAIARLRTVRPHHAGGFWR